MINMNSIGKDKLLHFFWNTILIIPLVALLGDVWGCILLATIGAAKEIVWDGLMKRGCVEFLDWVYGCMPIALYFIYNLI